MAARIRSLLHCNGYAKSNPVKHIAGYSNRGGGNGSHQHALLCESYGKGQQ